MRMKFNRGLPLKAIVGIPIGVLILVWLSVTLVLPRIFGIAGLIICIAQTRIKSFNVIVVEDCCAAATDELHQHELEIINMIYCHVVNLNEVKTFFVD